MPLRCFVREFSADHRRRGAATMASSLGMALATAGGALDTKGSYDGFMSAPLIGPSAAVMHLQASTVPDA